MDPSPTAAAITAARSLSPGGPIGHEEVAVARAIAFPGSPAAKASLPRDDTPYAATATDPAAAKVIEDIRPSGRGRPDEPDVRAEVARAADAWQVRYIARATQHLPEPSIRVVREEIQDLGMVQRAGAGAHRSRRDRRRGDVSSTCLSPAEKRRSPGREEGEPQPRPART